MAIILCPECKREISDKASACPSCGFPVSDYFHNSDTEASRLEKQMNCQFCGKENDNGSFYCAYCGKLINETEIQRQAQVEQMRLRAANDRIQDQQLRVQQEQLILQGKIQKQQEREYKKTAKCPRCGSTSLSGNKKGFGIGKAVVGAALTGGIGLIAGNIGAKKVRITCLKCGKQFWA